MQDLESAFHGQFGIAANTLTQFYMMGMQLQRKAYAEGVKQTLDRINHFLVSHAASCSSSTLANNGTISVNALVTFLDQMMSEISKMEKGKHVAPSSHSSQQHHHIPRVDGIHLPTDSSSSSNSNIHTSSTLGSFSVTQQKTNGSASDDCSHHNNSWTSRNIENNNNNNNNNNNFIFGTNLSVNKNLNPSTLEENGTERNDSPDITFNFSGGQYSNCRGESSLNKSMKNDTMNVHNTHGKVGHDQNFNSMNSNNNNSSNSKDDNSNSNNNNNNNNNNGNRYKNNTNRNNNNTNNNNRHSHHGRQSNSNNICSKDNISHNSNSHNNTGNRMSGNHDQRHQSNLFVFSAESDKVGAVNIHHQFNNNNSCVNDSSNNPLKRSFGDMFMENYFMTMGVSGEDSSDNVQTFKRPRNMMVDM